MVTYYFKKINQWINTGCWCTQRIILYFNIGNKTNIDQRLLLFYLLVFLHLNLLLISSHFALEKVFLLINERDIVTCSNYKRFRSTFIVFVFSLSKVIVLTADKGSIKDWTEIQFIETCSFHSRSFDNIESSFLAEKTSCYKKGFAKTETMVETTLPSYTLKC